ncbi:MAG: efflux RND transporter periplasmic adaptor subunit [Xanthomonadales bacterium]|nr:efflux RND transporter periplasmic adaptor subunit [Xanthomonadales bacterium]
MVHSVASSRLATLLAGSLILAACGSPAPQVPELRTVLVVQAQTADGTTQVFSGDVRARLEPTLAFRVGGKIVRRSVDAGARVVRGEVLAELDPEDLRLQAEAAKAQLAAAQAELGLAESERDRYREMLARGLVSQSLFDAKAAAFEAARAKSDSARAQSTVMDNQRDYARLVAPNDGVIAQRLAEAGQVVAAGQAVFVMAADGEREVAISVPELRVGEFNVGQSVQVELWSRPGEFWPARVRELSPSADPQARTFAARVSFATPAPVELGQSARVYVAKQSDAPLSVPLSAVGGEGEAAFVWVFDPVTSRVRKRPVEITVWGERHASVASGVGRGDWVVAGGVHLLREDERVRAVDRDNRPLDVKAAP